MCKWDGHNHNNAMLETTLSKQDAVSQTMPPKRDDGYQRRGK